MEIRAGTSLGRYQLLAEIGRGAMGAVYQALDPEIDRLVAVKTFFGFETDSEEGIAFRERFAQEARAAGRLAHPNIVAIYDRGEEPTSKIPYIVMEYVAGQPLSALMTASHGRMDERQALQIAKGIAEALHYAHEHGVIHRDIKPANVLVTEDGNAKIADFGVARLDTSNMTMHGQVLGTPAFMSPEQLTGGAVDGRSDIFSLGVLLYTMLMGFRPFQGNSANTIGFKVVNQQPVPITTFHLDLSKDTEYVVARAMAKNPSDRYQSGMAMAHDLSDILEGRVPRSRHEMDRLSTTAVSRIQQTLASVLANTPRNAHATGVAAVPAHSQEPSTGARTAVASAGPASSEGRRIPLSAAAVALLAFCGVSTLAAVYANDVQGRELHKADAVLPMPPPIQERVPVPAIGGDAREPVVEVNMPVPANSGSGRSPKAAISDLDRTVVHTAAAAPKPAIEPTLPVPVAAPKLAPPLEFATLELALEHHFSAAELEVWVDSKLEFSGTSVGQAKKRLLVLRGGVEGKESHEISFPGGEHDVKVHVSSKADQYDQTGIVHSTFLHSHRAVLEIRCNKRGIQLMLNNGVMAKGPR